MEFLAAVSKSMTFLHKYHHIQRKFGYFVHRNKDELAKIGHFQFSESSFNVENQLNLPENDFLT